MQAESFRECHPPEHNPESLALGALYRELQRIAQYHLRREPLGYMWTPASLINEAYIRLVGQYGKEWICHPNLTPMWSRIMRNILIDNARSFRAAKRNRGRIDPAGVSGEPLLIPNLELVITIRRALDTVRRADRRHAAMLELRFRDGLTMAETAEALKVSPRTAKRILKDARGRLLETLG